jgi:hypothetical protein
MANRSIWPTIKPTNAAGLPGDSGGHFPPHPGQNCQRPAPQSPWWSSSALGMPHHSQSCWKHRVPRPSGCAVVILIQHLPSPPSPPPSGQTIAITMPPHTGQAARSMGLVLVGVTTDTTCRLVAIGRPCVAWAMEGLMGVALSFLQK